ncbi:MAG: methyltransferase domain-containing protein [Planctomycetota bacterium]
MDGAPTHPVPATRTDSAASADSAARGDAAPRARLRAFRSIDAADPWIGSRNSLRPRDADRFEGDTPLARLARALCERSALPVKELFEAAEVFALARKRVRAPVVADLCCGHGLGGILFGLMERSVERVLLVDRVRPASADVLLDAADEVAPWVRPKVEWREARLERVEVPAGAGVLAVHACGTRTDRSLEVAVQARGPFAALPCCRPHRRHAAPDALKRALGADVAIDVHRTYALEAAGYWTWWDEIAPEITPMNRLITARPGSLE